jgi:hypothetical protein
MKYCKECDSEYIYLKDTDESECKCGGMYCGSCDAEYDKKGELIAGGAFK